MSLPYFPMFPTDFEADTSHLTLAEDGAYNRLLRLMWMTPGCSLPDDDTWVMRRMRCTTDEDCAIVANIIGEFFTRKGGRIINARLAKEYQKTDLAHKKRVNAGSKGGKAKSLKTKETGSSKAVAKPKQPEPEPEPYKKEDKSSQNNDDLFSANSRPPKPKLEDEFREFWKAYPRRSGGNPSKPAFEKFKAARKKAPLAEIMAGVKSLAASRQGEDPKFTPMAATWLNQERWKDAPAPKQGGGILDRIRMEQDQQRRAMERGLA